MKSKQDFITNVLYWGIIAGLSYLFVKYLLPGLVPFIVGILLAYVAMKICKYVFHNEKKPIRSISLTLVYLVLSILIVLLAVFGVNKVIEFFVAIPNLYNKYILPNIEVLNKEITKIVANLPSEVAGYLTDSIQTIEESVQSIVLSFSGKIVSVATSIITGAPDALIDITVVIVSSFYFILDYEFISSRVKTFLDEKTGGLVTDIKYFLENNLFKIIRSYVVIMFVTFIELCIGFNILKIESAVVIALVTTVLDIMPILGVGTVLIPWGILDLIFGKYYIGVGMLILYTIITLIRNVIEPKLVGGDLGLHPLATLIAMMIGLNLFGILGMFGIPIACSFIINRNQMYEAKEKME